MCELSYSPQGPEKLENYEIACTIVNGPKYRLSLSGVGHKPCLDLSFYRHDFGIVFVHKEGMSPTKKILRARNDDTREISFDIHQESDEILQVLGTTFFHSEYYSIQFHSIVRKATI